MFIILQIFTKINKLIINKILNRFVNWFCY